MRIRVRHLVSLRLVAAALIAGLVMMRIHFAIPCSSTLWVFFTGYVSALLFAASPPGQTVLDLMSRMIFDARRGESTTKHN